MKYFKVLAIIVSLLLAAFLLIHNYDVYPQRGATSDEYAFSFLGSSLITKHYPISWSFFPSYSNRVDTKINGIWFPIVSPYLDHPPLFGLLVGGWIIVNKQVTFQAISLHVARQVPVALNILTSLFVFLLSKKLYGYKTALWSLLIFGTTTFFVVNSRIVVAETLISPLLIGSLYLYVLFQKKLSSKVAISLGILSGLALLTKALGIIVFLCILFFLMKEKRSARVITLFICAFLFFALIWVWYGIYFGHAQFWHIQALQSNRHVGPTIVWRIIQNPIIVNHIEYSGWYYFGLFSLLFSLFRDKKNVYLTIPALLYVILLISSLTIEGTQGWYYVPLFPLMAIASSHVLLWEKRENATLLFVFLLLVGFDHMKYLYEDVFGLSAERFRVLIAMLALPSFITYMFNKKRLFSFIGEAWFYIFIIGNVIRTLIYIHPA